MNQDFLKDLNKSQLEAVQYCDGPSLVIAGAGSGKTRVLTYKIAYLLSLGMKPWNILALTFTNKAAREMKHRIGELVGNDLSEKIYMGTFHSIFSRILRVEAEHIGYRSNFTIYDENDSVSLIKSIIKEMKLTEDYKPSIVRARISYAKNKLISPEKYSLVNDLIQKDDFNGIPRLKDIYQIYSDRCKKANAMDFDDLLTNTFFLFKQYEDIRQKYAHHFHFVLIDEYQDTNSLQKEILWQLTSQNQKVCAVGDDAQSIYAFRGANIDNILNFQSQYNDTKLFKLEQNYRSTKNIVLAANSLIKHNQRQIEKDLYSENEMGEKLCVKSAYNDKEEAIIVCDDIKRLIKKYGYGYNDFAILYRRNHLSLAFEQTLSKRGIPYKVYGGLAFYQRKEIKDVLSYFRIVINPDDEEAFKRIINYPKRGIGDTTISKISSKATSLQLSLWTIISSPKEYQLEISKTTINKLQDFQNSIKVFIEKLPNIDAYTLACEILDFSNIIKDLQSEHSQEARSKIENIQELLNSIKAFIKERVEQNPNQNVTLSDFIREVALQTDMDRDNNEDTQHISIMTMHSAKGLEFPVVFIAAMEKDIIPDSRSLENKRQEEEERRLFYVAITRAKKMCFLSYAQHRYKFGSSETVYPSPFLNDLDKKFIDFIDEELEEDDFSSRGFFLKGSPNKRQAYKNDFSSKPKFNQEKKIPSIQIKIPVNLINTKFITSSKMGDSPKQVKMGDIIEHDRFGKGVILKVEGKLDNTKATVNFEKVGIKQLLLKYARFKIIK